MMTVEERISQWVDAHEAELIRDIGRLVAVRSVRGEAEPDAPFGPGPRAAPVAYTHLDVYKRQDLEFAPGGYLAVPMPLSAAEEVALRLRMAYEVDACHCASSSVSVLWLTVSPV